MDVAPVRLPAAGNSPAAMRQAARNFEAQALGALLQPMFQGLRTSGTFGGGAAEAQWRPMLVDAIAKDLSRIGGLGIGEAVLRELTRIAGAQPGTTQNTETPSP
ncbi:rod-binding protein [Falsiroseomonas sp. E2-1-a20]|uniref:rod-binding protein n=1 Tax=Falsiroseomonas sp. E2-1-a20 TaxID=3239300 RepID=UPI003F397F36